MSFFEFRDNGRRQTVSSLYFFYFFPPRFSPVKRSLLHHITVERPGVMNTRRSAPRLTLRRRCRPEDPPGRGRRRLIGRSRALRRGIKINSSVTEYYYIIKILSVNISIFSFLSFPDSRDVVKIFRLPYEYGRGWEGHTSQGRRIPHRVSAKC